ncbi:hypothetical protein DB278_04135 [Pasteurella multocida]|nr:hypothetical protein DB278_04135 [Pasteurella multocida]
MKNALVWTRAQAPLIALVSDECFNNKMKNALVWTRAQAPLIALVSDECFDNKMKNALVWTRAQAPSTVNVIIYKKTVNSSKRKTFSKLTALLSR